MSKVETPSIPALDWKNLGLKAGIEIHQQLETEKLFCRCPSTLEEDVVGTFVRRLRPTQSELGELDRAAVEAAEKNLVFEYQSTPKATCLVEMDEEPPHAVSSEAVEVALTAAALLSMRPVDEIDAMRKLVIDGSNTSGFQRTCLLATGGDVATPHGKIPIQTLCLEEDAARVIERRDGRVVYRLDRLGIPLVEIATAPELRTPEAVRDAAAAIGALLRATGRVKRGLGTIRQDLNVSIEGGARTETKGVQSLDLVPTAVAWEAWRQKRLLEVRERLAERGTRDEVRGSLVVDVSGALAGSESKVVQAATSQKGAVLALRLPGFGGLLGGAKGAPRLGAEVARYAVVRAGVRGLFHSDELPNYGITAEETEKVRAELGCGDDDAFVLVAAPRAVAEKALEAARGRALLAFEGVPEETRDMKEDGTNEYSRPLPGRARMYPETDTPPMRVRPEDWERIRKDLPELPDAKRARMLREYGLSPDTVEQLFNTGNEGTFEAIVAAAGAKDAAPVAARLLLQTVPELLAEGVHADCIDEPDLVAVVKAVAMGSLARDAV
ncbi:MAG: Glu-tRNA(Gln) amidotransferase subunit GatE, partial [Methanobacteriota archaeon]